MIRVIVIGASAGGVDALMRLLPAIQSEKVSVLVVQHLPANGPNLLVPLLFDVAKLPVKEAEPGETMRPGTIYVAAADYHLEAEPNGTLSLSSDEPVNFSRPSIDVLMESVAVAYGEEALGILLTGSNSDGALGMRRLHLTGAVTIIEDPAVAEYPTMPAACLKLFKPDHILSQEAIRDFLSRLPVGETYE